MKFLKEILFALYRALKKGCVTKIELLSGLKSSDT